MSAPKTLMTWRINSALNCDVSIYSLFFFFFANGGLCESLVSRPWRRFPSILTQNSLGSEINELFFLRVCRVQLNRWRFFGKNGRVITHSAAWLRFLNIRQPKTSHFCPSVVVVIVFIGLVEQTDKEGLENKQWKELEQLFLNEPPLF